MLAGSTLTIRHTWHWRSRWELTSDLQVSGWESETGLVWTFEPPKIIHRGIPLPIKPHLLSFPNSSTNWQLIIQIFEPMGVAILIQTNRGYSLGTCSNKTWNNIPNTICIYCNTRNTTKQNIMTPPPKLNFINFWIQKYWNELNTRWKPKILLSKNDKWPQR